MLGKYNAPKSTIFTSGGALCMYLIHWSNQSFMERQNNWVFISEFSYTATGVVKSIIGPNYCLLDLVTTIIMYRSSFFPYSLDIGDICTKVQLALHKIVNLLSLYLSKNSVAFHLPVLKIISVQQIACIC